MLFPDAVGVVDPVVVYADLPQNEHRPCVRLNMIVSVDGGTSWGGVSGALGGSADKALFTVLRSVASLKNGVSHSIRQLRDTTAIGGTGRWPRCRRASCTASLMRAGP